MNDNIGLFIHGDEIFKVVLERGSAWIKICSI